MNRIRNLAVVLVVLLSPMAANADPIRVTTSDGVFDVTQITTSIAESSALLMSQIWWDESSLAFEFAELVADALGVNDANGIGPGTQYFGPLFMHAYTDNGLSAGVWCEPPRFFCQDGPKAISWGLGAPNVAQYDFRFGIATPVHVPEPGTLSLLVLGLFGMGLTRKRIA